MLGNGISRVFVAPEGNRIKISFSEFRFEDGKEYMTKLFIKEKCKLPEFEIKMIKTL